MIPIIGIMLGTYITARFLEMLGHVKLVHVVAALGVFFNIIAIASLFMV